MNRRITIELDESVSAWECGGCTVPMIGIGCDDIGPYKRCAFFPEDKIRYGYNVNRPLFHLRCPACLFAETGIQGYRRGEEGRQCRDCGFGVNVPLGMACENTNHESMVNPDGTCPRWEKG